MRRTNRTLFRFALLALVLLLVVGVIASHASGTSLASAPLRNGPLWQDASEANIVHTGNRDIVPSSYRLVTIDPTTLTSFLATGPLETELTRAYNSPAIIGLPLPDGTMGHFSFVNSPVMEPALAAQYPGIQTYVGQGIDDKTATVRFDRTQWGFHAMILSVNGPIFIDPYQRGDTTTYISYRKSAYIGTPDDKMVELAVEDTMGPKNPSSSAVSPATGPQLRTYRLALAATGEYTAFYGGTVPGALAGMVTSVNRVTGVYEREVAVRMVLIANDSSLIYTDPSTDPYTNNDGGAMLGENQSNIDSVIGAANYDIGHVFSTGGGGVAFLGVVCSSGNKAKGVTGS
ncbi:MAG: zinc-dependent metalloprotease family protein, partial [Chloroflexia bacterium]